MASNSAIAPRMNALPNLASPLEAGQVQANAARSTVIRPTSFPTYDGLDSSICWQAIYSRDPRFDGRFFAGATTTGLYCRNVCPVPFARPRNIVLFACAAAAESVGFRPCKRCQPQAAPGTPAWLGTSAVVSRAFRLILEGALNEGSVEMLAARLGLGSRQLRRLFVQHLGASPLKIATTRRVHLARKLIDESRFSMTQIAFCSGFNSIREFNHAVRLSTGQSPSDLRRAAATFQPSAKPSGLELRLPYRQPFDWESMIGFLKQRAIPGVELVTRNSYQRTIEIGGVPGFITVKPDAEESRLLVTLEIASYEGLAQTVERIRRIFDLAADPIQIASHLSGDPQLAHLLRQRPGLRVPGVWDGFETAVLALMGETLSTRAPRPAVARLMRNFGTPVETTIPGLTHLFPQPAALASANLSLAGLSEVRAHNVHRLARAVMSKQLSFATSKTLDQAVAEVASICNIDTSNANYIALRAFGEPDAFPTKDARLRRTLSSTNSIVTSTAATDLAEKWRPWRAYAAMHIALSRATELNTRRPQ
jgi:AraC family transcriptional regulator of adaptative response / DNA-3-methyladenine glycosylase II